MSSNRNHQRKKRKKPFREWKCIMMLASDGFTYSSAKSLIVTKLCRLTVIVKPKEILHRKCWGYNSKNDYASFAQHLFLFFQLAAWQCALISSHHFWNVPKTQKTGRHLFIDFMSTLAVHTFKKIFWTPKSKWAVKWKTHWKKKKQRSNLQM